MKKRNKKHEKRMKKLIVGCAICAIVLTASTYAWFIGMKTVQVSSFDVSIAAIDGLSLSLDGNTWSDTVTINKDNYKLAGTPYAETNTNVWGGKGLIPVSTVGKIDTTASRLVLYEKGSLTTTDGGYRIMASRVPNTGALESDGYVAFDLFVKNLSGHEYYKELNQKNEEAIYLATDSYVKVKENGLKKAGIENSVRVAFAEIGRVKATTTDVDTITGIKCNPGTNSEVTGICRDAQIWEPNDTKHVENAINWYNTSCSKRNSADFSNYGGDCNPIENGYGYQTYAVGGVILDSDYVDVYDGEDYNGWTGTIATQADDGKLYAYPYFTDTMKNYENVNRPTFITLAPNSITKVRVYVYIEGQDVDNYDFASLGKAITVAFGFTKERFFDEDVNYNDYGGTVTLPDDVIKDNHYFEITTANDN